MLMTRHVLLHRLTQERATVLHSFEFMPDEELTRRPAIGEWSVKDVLGHLADWEAETIRGIEQFLHGARPDILDIRDVDAWNAEHVRRKWDVGLDEIKEELLATRRRLLEILGGLPDEAWQKPAPPPHQQAFIPWMLNCKADHDREHWARLMEYRERWIARQQ